MLSYLTNKKLLSNIAYNKLVKTINNLDDKTKKKLTDENIIEKID